MADEQNKRQAHYCSTERRLDDDNEGYMQIENYNSIETVDLFLLRRQFYAGL